jgi:hypothetical protein
MADDGRHKAGASGLDVGMTGKLHAWKIEDREYARHEERRGRQHAFETLEPRRTALVVIDMVPFFVSNSGIAMTCWLRRVPPARSFLAAACSGLSAMCARPRM